MATTAALAISGRFQVMADADSARDEALRSDPEV